MALTAHVTTTAVVSRVERVRVALRWPERGVDFVDEHVRVALPAPAGWARAGDVLHEASAAPGRAVRVASRHPGALVVAVYDGEVCALRVGSCDALVRAAQGVGVPPWPVWASLAHAVLAAAGGGWFPAATAAGVSRPPVSS